MRFPKIVLLRRRLRPRSIFLNIRRRRSLLVALLGRGLVRRLGWLANPAGWFRRIVGALFILVGIAVIIGFDKQLQTWILDAGWYDPIAHLEELLG